jgi:hypothetical protein
MPTLTSDDCWFAINSLATEDGEADKIQPATIAKLIELKLVRIGSSGLPEMTTKGWQAHTVAESGDGRVDELDSLPPKV